MVIIFKILLSVALSTIIGLDRSVKSRGAGLRTYVIVCMAATLVMMLGDYLYGEYAGVNGSPDPARLGAQVISGIGFLGAGTIIQWRNKVKGLTTAAGLWGIACVGLAVGAGFYEGAVITILVMYVVLRFATRLERDYVNKNKTIKLFVEFFAPVDNMNMITRYAETKGLAETKMDFIGSDNIDGRLVLFAVGYFRQSRDISADYGKIIEELNALSYVRTIKIIDEMNDYSAEIEI